MKRATGLAEYFHNTSGTGILATCDGRGNVDVAIYARPYIIDEQTIAFSMLERLSYANLRENPKAAYMFVEKGNGHKGKRLYLEMTGEETDRRRIAEVKKQYPPRQRSIETAKHFVYFRVAKQRPLVGDKKAD